MFSTVFAVNSENEGRLRDPFERWLLVELWTAYSLFRIWPSILKFLSKIIYKQVLAKCEIKFCVYHGNFIEKCENFPVLSDGNLLLQKNANQGILIACRILPPRALSFLYWFGELAQSLS